MAVRCSNRSLLKEALLKREMLLALLLLSAAIITLIISISPAYKAYVESGQLDLTETLESDVYPPEEAMSNFCILESNLRLTVYYGDAVLDVYTSNLSLLKSVYLVNEIEDTVDLGIEIPVLFVNVTFASGNRLEYEYAVLGYCHPYSLLAIPGTFLAFVGIALGLVRTFIVIRERASHRGKTEEILKRKISVWKSQDFSCSQQAT
jgi:hypothetical protein